MLSDPLLPTALSTGTKFLSAVPRVMHEPFKWLITTTMCFLEIFRACQNLKTNRSSLPFMLPIDFISTLDDIQGRAKAAPNPPVGGGPSQSGGPTFYFTTTTLKVGIVDQC